MSVTKANQRWAPICGDCWYIIPGQNDYYPMATSYDQCASCGNEGTLVVNVHPEVVREAKAEYDARYADEE